MQKIKRPLSYLDNYLHFNETSLLEVVKKHQTPFYLYSQQIIEKNYKEFSDNCDRLNIDSLICFALKSNPNKKLLNILANIGAGADIVSGGELLRALEAGISPHKIVFSGVGKTAKEIELALSHEIYSFNVESIEELELINDLAKKNNKQARIAFRLNPKVHAKTHKNISTGFKTHKFGIIESDILEAVKSTTFWTHSTLVGLSVHIGSQLTCLDATELAIKKLCKCANEIEGLEFLDVGGGLGIDYDKENPCAPSVEKYLSLVADTINHHYKSRIRIVFEPGRKIMATAGIFVSSVIRTKVSEGHHFTIVDGGMNDFARPSLYDAFHEIYPSKESENKVITDIVGPICETTDCFGQRTISSLCSGDFIAIADAGAYGFSMSSNYNLRLRPKEFLLDNEKRISEINNSQSYEDLL